MIDEPLTHRKAESHRGTTASRVRRRQRPSPIQLSVALSIPHHVREKVTRGWIVQTSTKALLLHIVYARGVCPAPATEMLRAYQESSKRRLSPIERKFVQCGASLKRMLEEWDILSCSTVDIRRVLITLGPSWCRQKEHHVLDFSNVGADDALETTEPSAGQEHALSRRLVRALLDAVSDPDGSEELNSMAHPSPAGSSYQVHLSVWIPSKVAYDIFEKSRDSTVASPWQKLSQSLILRPDFSASTHYASKRAQPHAVTTNVICSVGDEDERKEETGLWLSLPTSLKGFRLY